MRRGLSWKGRWGRGLVQVGDVLERVIGFLWHGQGVGRMEIVCLNRSLAGGSCDGFLLGLQLVDTASTGCGPLMEMKRRWFA